MPIPEILKGRMRLPVIGAPMFIVSTPRLVLAQCKAGIVGAFPALNARPAAQLDDWLAEITGELAAYRRAVLAAIRSGRACYQALTRDIGKHRNTCDRNRHRARKSKSPSTFPHATAKDTATRIAPAVITMANTPS